MFRRTEKPISDALADFLEAYPHLRRSRAEHRAVKAWYDLLGEGVGAYTEKIYYSRNALHVQLSSAVLRAELLLNKENLIERINEYAGMDILKDINIR